MRLYPGEMRRLATHARATGWLLATILLLGLGLRVLQLDFQPLWWDEGYSVFFATRDLATMLERTALDIHPPLYYALLQTWIILFGKSPIALRLLSVVIGVAIIPLTYLTARYVFGPHSGLVAAFLVASSPLQIYYSQEVRMYGLVTLLALASVALQLRLVREKGRGSNLHLVLYILLTSLALYTQYLAAFLVAAQIAAILYLKYRRRRKLGLRKWVLAWMAVLVLYLPWMLYAGPKLYAYVTAKVGLERYPPLDPLTFAWQHLAAFSLGHISQFTWLLWGTMVFALIAVAGFALDGCSPLPIPHFPIRDPQSTIRNSLSASRIPTVGYPLSALYLFIPLAFGFFVNLIYPFHPIRYERLLLFAAPFFTILVARGLHVLCARQWLIGIGAGMLVTVLGAFSLYDLFTVERYPNEDYRPLVRVMEQLAQPNDLVLALYPWQIGYLEAYYRGAPLIVFEVPSDRWIQNANVLSRDLERLRGLHSRVWLLAYQVQGRQLEDRLVNEFSNDYIITDEWFGNTRLAYFVQNANPLPYERNGAASQLVAPDLTLRAKNPSHIQVRAGEGLVFVALEWHAKTDVYNYSLRLVDGADNKLIQHDGPITIGTSIIRRALVVPRGTPPGSYTLRVVVYYRADGTPLPLVPSNALDLARVVVTMP